LAIGQGNLSNNTKGWERTGQHEYEHEHQQHIKHSVTSLIFAEEYLQGRWRDIMNTKPDERGTNYTNTGTKRKSTRGSLVVGRYDLASITNTNPRREA
jgi:hypothetical protein